jgi:hypothetical protein
MPDGCMIFRQLAESLRNDAVLRLGPVDRTRPQPAQGLSIDVRPVKIAPGDLSSETSR